MISKRFLNSLITPIVLIAIGIGGARIVADSWADAIFPITWYFGPIALLFWADDFFRKPTSEIEDNKENI